MLYDLLVGRGKIQGKDGGKFGDKHPAAIEDIRPAKIPRNSRKSTISFDGTAFEATVEFRLALDAALADSPSQAALDKLTAEFGVETRAFFQKACRNCFCAGRGLKAHSLPFCKTKNPCAMLCYKCRNTGCRTAQKNEKFLALRTPRAR